MARGTFRTKAIDPREQFAAVDDMKLKLSLAALSDQYSDAARSFIYSCYQDDQLQSMYRATRNSGVYQKGGKSKVHRKIIEFPNPYVFDFVDSVLSRLYGPNWLKEKKGLNHELVKPWHVVAKL